MDKQIISADGFNLEPHELEHFLELESVMSHFTDDYDLKVKVIKVGSNYEALLWGRLNSINFGVYQKSISVSSLADYLYSRLKKECRKAWKHNKSFYVKLNQPKTQAVESGLFPESHHVETHNYNFL